MQNARQVPLTADSNSSLLRAILDDFAAIFVPGGELIYVGGSEAGEAYFDQEALASLGVTVDQPAIMPDVVLYEREKNWLVLVEAVVAIGPIDESRHFELAELFKSSKAELIFVTAFPDRGEIFQKFVDVVDWGTHVWCASDPTHLIHFNGSRFFGPYHTP